MVLWVAGISAHPKAFPKPIDKGTRNPQLRTNVDGETARAIQTHETMPWSRIRLWTNA